MTKPKFSPPSPPPPPNDPCAVWVQKVAMDTAAVNNQVALVAQDYTDLNTAYTACIIADTFPGGPLGIPLSDAGIQGRLNALAELLTGTMPADAALVACMGQYEALQVAYDKYQSDNKQLGVLQKQLSDDVQAKFKAGC